MRTLQQPTKHVRTHTHKLKPLDHFTVVPQPLLPLRFNRRAPSWGPMDRGWRENPPGRSGVTSGGGGVNLFPNVGPPTSGDPLSQSGEDMRDPRRWSLFRPQALPAGPSGVCRPAGAPSVRSYAESLHPGAGILFGGSRPACVLRTEKPSPTRVGWTVPTLPREPPRGSSSRAPRGSEGVIGPELVDAITHVVRTEVARSLQESPAAASVPVPKAQTRPGGNSYPRRQLVYTSQSSDGEYSGGTSPTSVHPAPRRTPLGRRGVPTRQSRVDNLVVRARTMRPSGSGLPHRYELYSPGSQ